VSEVQRRLQVTFPFQGPPYSGLFVSGAAVVQTIFSFAQTNIFSYAAHVFTKLHGPTTVSGSQNCHLSPELVSDLLSPSVLIGELASVETVNSIACAIVIQRITDKVRVNFIVCGVSFACLRVSSSTAPTMFYRRCSVQLRVEAGLARKWDIWLDPPLIYGDKGRRPLLAVFVDRNACPSPERDSANLDTELP